MSEPSAGRLSDSPWFWFYLFCTVGLILLMLFQPRLRQRQQELDREGAVRRSTKPSEPSRPSSPGARQDLDHDPEIDSPEQGEPAAFTPAAQRPSAEQRFNWLYLILAILLIVAWTRLWWVRFRGTR